MKTIFVGIDLGNASSAICILDGEGSVLEQMTVEHSGDAYTKFAQKLFRDVEPASVRVAVEKPHGPLVELLMDRGAEVFSINPKQVDRFRDRYSMAGSKDDRRDALVLASSLRTDGERFRAVRLSDPKILALRELTRMRGEVLTQRMADASRLREQLHRYHTCLLDMMDPDEPWLWDLVKKFPTPQDAKKARLSGVISVLTPYRLRRFSAEEVLKALHQRPLHVAPGVVEAAREHVEMLIPRLHLWAAQIRECDAKITALLDDLESDGPSAGDDADGTDAPPAKQTAAPSDTKILRSIPGVGIHVAATLLGEASAAIADRDYQTLRALCGVAPVTKQSGSKRAVTMRRACSGLLRYALHNCARVNIQHDPKSKQLYASARARGHSYGHALRIVADRLLKTLTVMLLQQTSWDESRRILGATA